MVELAGIPPFGGGGVNIRQTSTAPAPAVPAVEASSAGQGLSGRMSSSQSHNNGFTLGYRASDTRSDRARREIVDPNALPGPPPTFQISLLELDRDLAQTLARLNAKRAIAGNVQAITRLEAEAPYIAERIAQPIGYAPVEGIKTESFQTLHEN